jgi:hypothetical protein
MTCPKGCIRVPEIEETLQTETTSRHSHLAEKVIVITQEVKEQKSRSYEYFNLLDVLRAIQIQFESTPDKIASPKPRDSRLALQRLRIAQDCIAGMQVQRRPWFLCSDGVRILKVTPDARAGRPVCAQWTWRGYQGIAGWLDWSFCWMERMIGSGTSRVDQSIDDGVLRKQGQDADTTETTTER